MIDKELSNRLSNLEDMVTKLFTIVNNSLSVQKQDSNYTLHSWLDEWYNAYKVPKLQSRSLSEISVCINNHIKPNIEDKPLNQITGLDVQKALNNIKTSRTKKYVYNVLGGAFKQALRLNIISTNIMLSVDSVKHKYKNGKALTIEQQKSFLKLITNNKFCLLYKFYLLTGVRRSEAIELKWIDIDFDNNLIHIRGTKTESSDRLIPLFSQVKNILSKVPKLSDKVFNTTVNAINCNFKRMKKQNGLDFRLHDLRHTFATRCLENGISMKTIQKWLGHSRLETTSNIYTHVQTVFEKEEILKYKPLIE